ncbi:MAG: Ig-like domain-containing protein [Anoxybacillus sp.]|nr:Ig-like domain-containing protein [Anoxybacillus sp.]MCL6584997.1 Ig-like domain-containing protein [Anoxybacillus sp.]
MDKKKAIKLATASAVVASAFVSANPYASQAATNVDAVVNQAKAAFKAVFITYNEVVKTGKLVDVKKVQDAIKKADEAKKKAVAEVNKNGGKKKDAYLADLEKSYKDYVTNGGKKYVAAYPTLTALNNAVKAVNDAVATKDLAKVKSAYDKLGTALKKATEATKSVYGADARAAFVKSANATIASLKNDTTVYAALLKAQDALGKEDFATAQAMLDKAATYLAKATSLKAELTALNDTVKASFEEKAGVVKEVSAVADVTVNEGETVTLPEKVEVTLANGKKVEKAVTWESKDLTKPGEYTLSGTFEGTELKATVKVIVKEVAPKVESVSAIGAKKLEVKFNKAVDDTKAKFEVKKGSVTASVSNITFAEDKKSAVIELASKLTKGDYTVNVSGLSEASLTSTVSVEDEKVAKIEILSDKGILVDGTDGDSVANDAIQVGYQVFNQYGEDITNVTSLNTSSSGGTVSLANGKATIQSASTFAVDQKVTLTLIHPETATTVTKTLTVSGESKVAEVSVKELYNANKETLSADSQNASDFMLVLEAKDQYGNVITDASKLDSEVLVAVSNPSVVSVKSLSGNSADFENVTIDGVSKTVLRLQGGLVAGSTTVTLISASTGKATTYTVNVAEGLTSDNVNFGNVDKLVAAGETVQVPVTVTDKNGNEITDVSILNGSAKGVTVTGATGTFKKVDGKVVYEFTAPNTAGPVTLTAVSKTGKVAIKTIDVKAAAVPTVITGLKSDVPKLVYNGETVNLDKASFVVEDQYGRTMSDASFASFLDANGTAANGEYRVVVSQADAAGTSAIDLSGSDDYITAQSNDTVGVDGQAKGYEDVTFKLQKYNGTSWVDVSGSSYTTSFRTVELSELKSFGVEDTGKIYADSTINNNAKDVYDKVVKVYGLTADGKKVYLPANTYSVVSNSPNLVAANVSGEWVLDAAENTTGAITTPNMDDNTEKTASYVVTINATGDEITKEVAISNVAPAIDTLEIRDNNGVAVSTFVYDITGGADTTFDATDLSSAIYVKDTYGVEKPNTTASTSISRLTFSNVKEASGTNISITGNGTANASIANLAAGDTFDASVTVGGKVVKVKVEVK